MGKKKGETSNSAKKEHLVWSTKMDTYFIEAMLNEARNGNRHDGAFTTTAYTNMLNHLRLALNLPELSKDNLKNRMKTLKDNFSQCYDLFRGLSGFNWSPVTKLWDAEPEVWEDLITRKPQALKWKSKEINNYDELYELFAKDRATGDGSETAKEKKRRWVAGNDTIEEILESPIDLNAENLCDLDTTEVVASPVSKSETTPENSVKSKLKKKKTSNFENDVTMIKDMFSGVVEVIDKGNKELISTLKSTRKKVYAEDEVYEKVAEMGIEEPTCTDAYLWLLQNEGCMRAIFGLPLERRKIALEIMMGRKQ